MPGSSSRRCVAASRRGWTLIELLLAVVIALLVVTLLLAAYHTVLSATRGQAGRQSQTDAAQMVHQLSRELQASFQPGNDTNCLMRLRQDPGFQLEWCATLLGAQEQDRRWFDVTRIRYHIATNGTDIVLLREAAPLTGPDALLPPVTNQVARGIRSLRIRFFDGDQWQSSWPVADAPSLPRAARITLRAGTPRTPVDITTDVFIPAGSVVSPRLP